MGPVVNVVPVHGHTQEYDQKADKGDGHITRHGFGYTFETNRPGRIGCRYHKYKQGSGHSCTHEVPVAQEEIGPEAMCIGHQTVRHANDTQAHEGKSDIA